MKKWILRYLVLNLLVFALPGSIPVSILKIGNLISHYQEHGQSNHSQTLFDFIASHYFDETHHNDQHADHSTLPFHSHHGESVSFAPQVPSLLPQQTIGLVFTKAIVHDTLLIKEVSSSLSSSYLDDIWQPPRA